MTIVHRSRSNKSEIVEKRDRLSLFVLLLYIKAQRRKATCSEGKIKQTIQVHHLRSLRFCVTQLQHFFKFNLQNLKRKKVKCKSQTRLKLTGVWRRLIKTLFSMLSHNSL